MLAALFACGLSLAAPLEAGQGHVHASGGGYHGHAHVGVGVGFYGGYYGFYPWFSWGPYSPYWSPWFYPPYPWYGYPYYPQSSVRIEVTPREAKVFVDGYFAGTVDDYDGTFQSLKLESGSYSIRLQAPGYQTIEFNVRITPTQKITYREDLRPE